MGEDTNMTQCSKVLLEKLTVEHLVIKDSIQSSQHLATALYPVPHESKPHTPYNLTPPSSCVGYLDAQHVSSTPTVLFYCTAATGCQSNCS